MTRKHQQFVVAIGVFWLAGLALSQAIKTAVVFLGVTLPAPNWLVFGVVAASLFASLGISYFVSRLLFGPLD